METNNAKPTVQRISIPLEGGDYRFIYLDIINDAVVQDKSKIRELTREFMRLYYPSVSEYSVIHSILCKNQE